MMIQRRLRCSDIPIYPHNKINTARPAIMSRLYYSKPPALATPVSIVTVHHWICKRSASCTNISTVRFHKSLPVTVVPVRWMWYVTRTVVWPDSRTESSVKLWL